MIKVDFGGTDIIAWTNSNSKGSGAYQAVIYNRDSASSQIGHGSAATLSDNVRGTSSTLSTFTASVDTTSAVTVAIQCMDNNSGTGGDDDTVTLEMLIIEQLGSGS